MIRKFGMLAAMAGSATAAHAGGLERTPQSMAVLFEEGRHFELNFATVSPSVSGTLGPLSSGDALDSYLNFGFAYKADINDQWSYAIIYDQPYGANVAYPVANAPYPAAGATADFESNALTAVLKYKMPNNVSIYGGVRGQTIEAAAVVPFVENYTAQGDRDLSFGYLVGAAYEKPEIALRVGLTYISAVDHDLATTETSTNAGLPLLQSVTEITMPQSLTLDFQSGVAEDTLVFGSVRWVEWTEGDITPAGFLALTGGIGQPSSLVNFIDDRITYTLGVARRLNETWAIAGSVSYEETTGSVAGNLAPVDGFTSVGLAAIYNKDDMEITAGVRYIDVGDATTTFIAADFSDNSAVAAGLKVGWKF